MRWLVEGKKHKEVMNYDLKQGGMEYKLALNLPNVCPNSISSQPFEFL